MKTIKLFPLFLFIILLAAGCSSESGDPANILTYSEGIEINYEFTGNQFSTFMYQPSEPDSVWSYPKIIGSVEINNISDAPATFMLESSNNSPIYSPEADTIRFNSFIFLDYIWIDSTENALPYTADRPVEIYFGDGRSCPINFHYQAVTDIIPGQGTHRFNLGDVIDNVKDELGINTFDYYDSLATGGTELYFCQFYDGFEAGLLMELNDINDSQTADSLDTVKKIIISEPYTPMNGKRGFSAGGCYAGALKPVVVSEFGESETGFYDDFGIGFIFIISESDTTVEQIHIY